MATRSPIEEPPGSPASVTAASASTTTASAPAPAPATSAPAAATTALADAASSPVRLELRVAGQPAPEPDSAHALTTAFYNPMRDRTLVDKRLVFEALSARLGFGCTTDKQEIAYASMAVFVERFGYVAAASQYDEWRKSSEAPPGLKSMTYIRNAFDRDWAKVREAFGEAQPQPDALAHRELLGERRACSRVELLDLVQLWAAPRSDALLLKAFRAWCEVSGIVAAETLSTLSPQTFRRLFGTWEVVLADAGLGHRSQRALRNQARSAAARPERAGLSPERERELRQAVLDWAAGRKGLLKMTDFDQHLKDLDGRTGLPVSYQTYRRHLGPWRPLLRKLGLGHRCERQGKTKGVATQAGLTTDAAAAYAVSAGAEAGVAPDALAAPDDAEATEAERTARRVAAARRATRGSLYGPKETQLHWLRHAAERFGPRMSYPQFDQWRKEVLAEAERRGLPAPSIPSQNWYRRNFGSWVEAKVEAGVMTAEQAATEPKRGRQRASLAVELPTASNEMTDTAEVTDSAEATGDSEAVAPEAASLPGPPPSGPSTHFDHPDPSQKRAA